jgi:uncharacterized protein involved in propanediol utilization
MNNIRTTISHLLNNQFVQAIGVPSSAAGFAAQIVDDAGAKRAIATQETKELACKCSPADACALSDTAAAHQFRIAKMIADLTRKPKRFTVACSFKRRAYRDMFGPRCARK